MFQVIEVQGARIEVHDQRIEYSQACAECCGHGFQPTEFMTLESCSECHGSGFKFHRVMEVKDGN